MQVCEPWKQTETFDMVTLSHRSLFFLPLITGSPDFYVVVNLQKKKRKSFLKTQTYLQACCDIRSAAAVQSGPDSLPALAAVSYKSYKSGWREIGVPVL